MGSIDAQPNLQTYSVPAECRKVLQNDILSNPKIAKDLSKNAVAFTSRIKFTGNDLPSVPINWRFAESSAALKGLEACLITDLVKQKYGVDIESMTINTDHASLFFMSTIIWSFADQPNITDTRHTRDGISGSKRINDLIPNYDFYATKPSYYGACATNIYPTKDGRWFHLHGSLNPEKSLASIGFPPEAPSAELDEDWDKCRKVFIDRMKTIDSGEMQRQASDVYKQAGVIANTCDQFRKSEHGKANEHIGLFEIHDVDSGHKASWWPDSPQTSAARALAGLKVVDLTRIIAAPAVTRSLAELGASVMRVTSPHQPDFSRLHIDLNWGKWNSSIDLKDPPQREKLKALILEADVVVQGYRPGVLDKYGFGQDDIIELVKGRDRGIISVRENCYGWNGPWSYRTGWQQISDACVGISHRFGQAMGLTDDEPVTPVFPNSDYMTGIAGSCGIITALLRRAEKGGSYKVGLSLNYYNQWLADSCGEYPKDVWEDVWSRNGKKVFRAWDNMSITIPAYTQMLRANSRDVVFNEEFFEVRKSGALDTEFHCVKPIINFDKGEVKLGYNVGTRGNGKDAPRWPDDLMTEVVV